MSRPEPPSGLEAILFAHREQLLRFLRVRGAGEQAEDLLQELWIKVAKAEAGPIASPLAYLYRAANSLMIDRFRSQRQAGMRDADWADAVGRSQGRSDEPSADRGIAARQEAALVMATLDALEPQPRVRDVFRLHRIDGISQRLIADRLGVSVSTVESDLRKAYRALAALRERLDEE